MLFTISSKPEARDLLGRGSGRWHLDLMLEQRYPQIRFDWDGIRAGIEERMHTLPDIYPYREGEVSSRFRRDLCAFTRQLGLADPQDLHWAAELLSEHRMELEYLRDLISWRLSVCEPAPNDLNGDNAFHWRRRLQANDEPPEVIELMAVLYNEGDLDRVEALARLFVALIESQSPLNPADGNVAIYDDGQAQYPIGVNLARDSGLFRQCAPNSSFGCQGSGGTLVSSSCEGLDQLIGTPYGANDPGCGGGHTYSGGATDWLTMTGNVVPGEVFTIKLFVFDAGENGSGLADALVLLDNWRWNLEASAPGVNPQ